MNDKPRYFTLSEIRRFDGKAGKPAYIAFKGKVYDVSKSRLWPDGDHQGHHVAGGDLTPGLVNAPHDEAVLSRFPVIGELKQESYANRLQTRVERLHLHSMFVHFSVALGLLTPAFALAYLLTGQSVFEATSSYLLILLWLTAPLSGLSGVFSWRVTYESRRSRIFDRKLVLTVVVTLMVTVCGTWRVLSPDVLTAGGYPGYVYLALLVVTAAVTAILGHYGGKILFP